MNLHERAEQVVAALTIEPNKGSFEADAHEWSAKCKTTDELIALIEQALRDVVEECAKVAETEGVYPELNVYAGGPDWYKHGKAIASAIRRLKEEG